MAIQPCNILEPGGGTSGGELIITRCMRRIPLGMPLLKTQLLKRRLYLRVCIRSFLAPEIHRLTFILTGISVRAYGSTVDNSSFAKCTIDGGDTTSPIQSNPQI